MLRQFYIIKISYRTTILILCLRVSASPLVLDPHRPKPRTRSLSRCDRHVQEVVAWGEYRRGLLDDLSDNAPVRQPTTQLPRVGQPGHDADDEEAAWLGTIAHLPQDPPGSGIIYELMYSSQSSPIVALIRIRIRIREARSSSARHGPYPMTTCMWV